MRRTKQLAEYSSVDAMPDEIPTDRLEEFKIRVGRADFVEVSDEADMVLHSDAEKEKVIRSFQVGSYGVEVIAKKCQTLNLDWLYTTAEVSEMDGEPSLSILQSARYTEGTVEEEGDRAIIRKINEDRRELGRIMESYCSYRESPVVFDAEVRVEHQLIGTVGTDHLHGCIYEDYSDFAYGRGYVHGMVSSAIDEARGYIESLQRDLC